MGKPLSRRDFLRGRPSGVTRVLPPGFLGDRHESCVGCKQCIDHCPTSIIVIDDGMPRLDFSQGECTFCGECAAHCPHSDVLFGAPRQFRHVVQIAAHCLPQNAVDCQACRDYCPTTAIRFRPRLGGPFLPEINEDACTGCGACIGVCPVGAVSVKEMTEMSDA